MSIAMKIIGKRTKKIEWRMVGGREGRRTREGRTKIHRVFKRVVCNALATVAGRRRSSATKSSVEVNCTLRRWRAFSSISSEDADPVSRTRLLVEHA